MVREGIRRFGDAVSATGMLGSSEDKTGTESCGGFCNANVICGDDHVVDLPALLATLPDVLNERFAGDEVERLAWEAGGTPAGRNGYEGMGRVGSGQGVE